MRTLRWSRLIAGCMLAAGLLPAGADAQNLRSAQGDCTREAAKYRLTVLESSNYRQLPNGWQLDLRVRDSRGRVDTGTCMVFGNGSIRLYGFDGVGGGAGSGGSISFNCASKDTRYKECQLPVDGRVELTQRWSEARCQEGYSWGRRGDRIWVDHGCRAEFTVTPQSGGGGGQVDCRSSNNRYQECKLPSGMYGRLDREYSNQRCREGDSWGTRAGWVWVNNGCQARFQVTRNPGGGGSGGSSGGGDNPGQQQRAEVQCRNEARRQSIEVREVTQPRNMGSYWQARVHGSLRGNQIQADCRFDPRNNQTTVFVDSSGGGGGGGGSGSHDENVRAEQACHAQAQRLGYKIVGTTSAQPAPDGRRVALQLKQANKLYQASCLWNRRTGRADIEQVQPQPR